MKIVKPYISSLAKEFWHLSGLDLNPPYDIQGAVSLRLPLDIVFLSELSILKIEKWLTERGINLSIGFEKKSLHGFILTYQNCGFIFINGSDSENERRYTIAHEISHYILDYQIPREAAIKKLGPNIIEVLDGLREPTHSERIDGILSKVQVRPFTHLLERSTDGSYMHSLVLDAENDADSLALELLAPACQVIKDSKGKDMKLVFDVFRNKCFSLLKEKYDLPQSIAEEYSSRISYMVMGGPSILTKLGFEFCRTFEKGSE